MREERESMSILPVSLLAEGRPCLVVGGGKVALRKIGHLLDAGASVTVVSATALAEIETMEAEGRLLLHRREFEASDVANAFLVFSATDDKPTNRLVLAASKEAGALCCSVDGNWVSGDFVTPASLRKDGLTVSVSTGGRSCRRSRLVKDNLAKHIRMVESADLIVMGTSHQYLSLEKREHFHLAGKRMDEVGRMLMHVWGIHEFVLLNTCNRVELLAVVSREAVIDNLLKRILAFFHLDSDQYYVKRGFDAFQHLAVMSAGLLSQTPGENHIVSQIKEALDYARESGWSAGMMDEWISSALHVSKRIRSEIRDLLHGFEIEDLCIKYIQSECASMRGKRALVIGTGTIGTGTVRQLADKGVVCEWCYHVNRPESPDMKNVSVHSLNDIRTLLPEVDMVICATSSSAYVIHKGHAPLVDQEKEVLIVDLSIPRNVEPGLNGLTENLKVADLDDLKHWYRREAADMSRIQEISNGIAEDHRNRYERIIESFQSGNQE